ncbi:MAG: lysostaphin resistance A-like protein, partial [Solirubrobacterales bacterium]
PPAGPAAPVAAANGPRGSLPSIPWSFGDTGWGLLAGLVVAFIVAPALVLPFDPDLERDGALLAAQGLLGVSLVTVSIGVATRWRFGPLRPALASLGLRRFAPVGLAWMLVAMFAYYLAAALFASLVIQPEQEDIGGELGVGDENLLVAIAAVVLIGGLAPVAEELFFRGFLFSGLRTRLPLWPAAAIAGLVFGGIHAVTGITTVIPLAALGVALCWLYERTGSLWPCVIAHTLNNGLALILIT